MSAAHCLHSWTRDDATSAICLWCHERAPAAEVLSDE